MSSSSARPDPEVYVTIILMQRPLGREAAAPVRLRLARALCSRMPPVGAQKMRDLIYPRATARADDYWFTVKAQTGSPFTGTTAEWHGYPFSVHGYYNWRNIAIAEVICRPGDIIIEIGANVGTETVGFSDIVGERGKVHAFEPFPANVDCLRRVAAEARYRNIDVFPIALSDRQGQLRFAPPRIQNSGMGHVVDQPSNDSATSEGRDFISVRCATLDSLTKQVGGARLLAIDAEGHELAILRGAREYLRTYKPAIILEVLEDRLAFSGATPEQVADQLRSLEYELSEISRFGTRTIGRAGSKIPRQADWVALPRSQGSLIREISAGLCRCALSPMMFGLNPLRKPASARR
jgi:FkbM family methyltransferase